MNIDFALTPSPTTTKCSKSWCKQQIPPNGKYKACEHCRDHDRRTKATYRESEKAKKVASTRKVGQKEKRQEDSSIPTEFRLPVRQRLEGDKSDDENDGGDIKVYHLNIIFNDAHLPQSLVLQGCRGVLQLPTK